MKYISKYLKPYIFVLLITVVLLFAQALSNLYLPDYMSDIVNIGLQKEGVEEVSPNIISVKGMEFCKAIMNDSDKQVMEQSYTLSKSGSQELDKYEKTFNGVKTQNVYVKKDMEKEDLQKVDEIYQNAMYTFVVIMSQHSQGEANTDLTQLSSEVNDINTEELYALIPMIESIPKQQIDSIQEKVKDVDEMVLQSVGSFMTKTFYKELNADISKMQKDYITKIGAIMILITLVGAVASIIVGFFASKISSGVAKKVRHDIFKKIQSYSKTEIDKFSTSSLITRTTNDITQIQNILGMGIRLLLFAPVMGIGGVILALKESVSMSWVILLTVIVLLFFVIIVFSVTLPKFRSLQSLTDKINLVTRENLSGVMVIRAFGTQKHEEKRFDYVNKELTDVNLFINRVMALLMPIMTIFMNLLCVLIIWVGADQISQSKMNIGSMMAFMQYIMLIIMSFLMISMMFIMVPRASVSAKRITEILTQEILIKDPENPKHIEKDSRGSVEFKNVSFVYGNADEKALDNINFVAKPGETTAFIGPTGAGKTTLINLISRFYDVSSGSILVNGVDVRDLTQKELRQNIGLVPQKGILFSGTISSNIRYGNENMTEEEVKKIAEISQAIEFIETKPEKFESKIAQKGDNVSGGQKQRLCIARALAKDAPIYIFDDSFSALDYNTDAKLRQALKSYTKDSAVLIVAQRISTIKDANNIIVLDEGKMVGKGTHKELLKNCPTYYEIAKSQLSKEDLLNG